jgi:plastocyanin
VRKFILGVMAALAALVPMTLIAPGASATLVAKSKPPVKLSGKVNNQGAAVASSNAVELDQRDYSFSPTFVKIPAGATSLTVTVKNMGQHQHTFTVSSQQIDKVLNPGDSVTVTVNVPGPGAIGFSCRFHKSQGMQGAFFDKNGAKLISSTGAKSPSTSGSGSGSGSGGYGY